MTLRSAEQHYSQQAQLAYATARQVDGYWRRVRADDVDAWRQLLEPAVTVVAAGQLLAARAADGYVSAALVEQGADVPTVGRVNAAGFAGMANGPVPVADLLDLPRIGALEAIAQGAAPAAALAAAGRRLQGYALSLVQDAGRQAVSAAITARPAVGWRRMVNVPCCERCAILAGKWFKWNQGFQRHPRCDCTHIPAAEDSPGNIATDPDALFASGQVRGLREAEAKAIADGADPIAVVNARRGRDAAGMFTTEGTTRRGVAGRAIRALRSGSPESAISVGPRGTVRNYTVRRVARPTPDAIYKYARSREDALQLLADNGYIRR